MHTSCPQSPQPLLQPILFLGVGIIGLRIDGGGGGFVELVAEFEAGIVGQLAEQFVYGVFADLGRCRLGDGVLVDAIGHGVFFVLLLELLEGDEGLTLCFQFRD